MQKRLGCVAEGTKTFDAVLGRDNHLAGFDIANELRADDVERTGLGRQDRRAFEIAQHQRAHAPRIAHADQLLRRQGDERIGAVDLLQRIDQTIDDGAVGTARHQMEDRFGVGRRLEDGALVHEVFAQKMRIGQIAVMGQRNGTARQIGIHGLDIAREGAAGRRVAHVTESLGALQLLGMGTVVAEDIADQSRMAFGDELHAVEGHDAGGFLAAVLQGMKPQHRQRASVGTAEDTEDAALLVQGIVVEGRLGVLVWAGHCWLLPLPVASMSLSSARRSSAP